MRFALAVEPRITHINDTSLDDTPTEPFGREKNSGIGRFGGEWIVDESCTDDAQLRYVPMGKQGDGRIREVGKIIWSSLIDAFPDLRVRAESAFGDERNLAAEVMIGGTQRKDFMNIPNQGRHYDLPHAFLLQVSDRGLITSITAYWDNASFYSQLGKKTLE